jgi:hypothetical protein
MAFQPDFVWIKDRYDGADQHALFDSIRGATKRVFSSSTSEETTTASTLTSFDSNGFSLSSSPAVNQNGNDFVAWCWKAGGDEVSGTGTSGITNVQVSANTDAGFSIVTYEGSGTAGATITHGLDSTPELFFIKRRTSDVDWMAVAKIGSSYQRAKLNDVQAFSTSMSGATNGVDPTDTVITLGNSSSVNIANNDFVAYCFHSVDGYQKVGTYEGNGDVKTVYTDSNGDNTGTGGFQPRWVMIKNADDLGNWMIYDTIRDTDGTVGKFLEANTTDIEADASSAYIVPNSTGFTTGDSNSVHLNKLNQTFIYLAIA